MSIMRHVATRFTTFFLFLDVFETVGAYPKESRLTKEAFREEQDMRKLGILVMVLVVAMMSIPAASAKSSSRPFKGSASGVVTFPMGTECENYGGANVRTDSDAIGRASHMGRTIVDGQHCTPEPGVDTIEGTMTLIAANGDKVFLEYAGVNGPPDPVTWILVSEVSFFITGGTGRFEGAEGSGDMTAFVLFEGLDDPEWAVTWVWEGTIGY